MFPPFKIISLSVTSSTLVVYVRFVPIPKFTSPVVPVWLLRDCSIPASAASNAFCEAISCVEVLSDVMLLEAIDKPTVKTTIKIKTTIKRTCPEFLFLLII
ncbi:MAG: hypothetical protein ACD_37C00028G0001 [uncultured bacterium]|nr:MAG: hypothetical protein ACD_37C00028G0001 [uncultured bacterium]